MKLRVKSKLWLGLTFLFILIVLTGLVGLFAINRLANESKNILNANYESVVYAKNMQIDIDDFEKNKASAITDFEKNLEGQEKNITERGEMEATAILHKLFDEFRQNDTLTYIIPQMRKQIATINQLNLNAILNKSNVAQHTANNAKHYLETLITVCFLLSFSFLLAFPGYIANPIKELDIAKTNFIATISHELKTPISSIKMSLKLLEDSRVGTLNNEQGKLIHNIKDDTQRLLSITGELLDLAQVETGNITLDKELVEPFAIIEYANRALRVQAEQKHITIKIDCPPDLPKVNCDLEKTAWVMVNFLSNAIRYSPENSEITMEANLTNDGIVFSTADHGKGIEQKYLEKVFDKFNKIQSGESGKSGTGLGLAISKEFILAQGGKIWVKSELNKGSKFLFVLPT